ncbi:hypothetical protein HK097_007789 [Rhizophlyctis rosea]|uniref:Uncharacterized protein n=1 Tax=Rhizophlyctis rosea TaxID=64517 RepID=A0AAD5SK89_9FUNG|nr:hypothetical protein HK097_007789 [Rhizophlyctis rosea]
MTTTTTHHNWGTHTWYPHRSQYPHTTTKSAEAAPTLAAADLNVKIELGTPLVQEAPTNGDLVEVGVPLEFDPPVITTTAPFVVAATLVPESKNTADLPAPTIASQSEIGSTPINTSADNTASIAAPSAIVVILGAILAIGFFVVKRRSRGNLKSGFLPFPATSQKSDPFALSSGGAMASIADKLRSIPDYLRPAEEKPRKSVYTQRRYETDDIRERSGRVQSLQQFLQEKEIDLDAQEEERTRASLETTPITSQPVLNADQDATQNNRLSLLRKYTPATPSPLSTTAPITPPAPEMSELAPPPLIPTMNTNGAGDVFILPQPSKENHRLSMKAFTAYNNLEGRSAGEWKAPSDGVTRERGPGEFDR